MEIVNTSQSKVAKGETPFVLAHQYHLDRQNSLQLFIKGRTFVTCNRKGDLTRHCNIYCEGG